MTTIVLQKNKEQIAREKEVISEFYLGVLGSKTQYRLSCVSKDIL